MHHTTQSILPSAPSSLTATEISEKSFDPYRAGEITGKRIAGSISAFLKENNVPVGNIRGQEYDGASNMSSCNEGVQAQIRHAGCSFSHIHTLQ